MAGGNLTVTTSGAIDNQRGLLQADDTLTLTASSLDNSNTLTASNAPAKGVLGKVVSIVAGRVNNQGGAISAGQDLGIKTGELDNTAGEALARRRAHRGRHAQEHAGQAAGGQEPDRHRQGAAGPWRCARARTCPLSTRAP